MGKQSACTTEARCFVPNARQPRPVPKRPRAVDATHALPSHARVQ